MRYFEIGFSQKKKRIEANTQHLYDENNSIINNGSDFFRDFSNGAVEFVMQIQICEEILKGVGCIWQAG